MMLGVLRLGTSDSLSFAVRIYELGVARRCEALASYAKDEATKSRTK
jgi:hypothetical protein